MLTKLLMLLFTVSVFVLSACQEQLVLTDEEQAKYREIAWNAVDTEQRKHVVKNWTEADVSTFKYKDQWIAPQKDRSRLKNQELVMVSFSTDQDGLLGPIVVVINPGDNSIAGYFPRY
ncbi:hypothetical protein BK138_35325 [Paenibacillus rhizosphaerae]|uniref:DUF3887 domain-containing protein n=1 Tax=Paenibacillus rhizosphaerae TaxID=297318 RepID=A0A1R1DVF9_9BACL|nr:hypothetical protein [Paenibacillus rhizosphaerae]OMF43567.1 hypothetical protein BK138_35325 [Paenibacillus rhizosphaerae]